MNDGTVGDAWVYGEVGFDCVGMLFLVSERYEVRDYELLALELIVMGDLGYLGYSWTFCPPPGLYIIVSVHLIDFPRCM